MELKEKNTTCSKDLQQIVKKTFTFHSYNLLVVNKFILIIY